MLEKLFKKPDTILPVQGEIVLTDKAPVEFLQDRVSYKIADQIKPYIEWAVVENNGEKKLVGKIDIVIGK